MYFSMQMGKRQAEYLLIGNNVVNWKNGDEAWCENPSC
jgi:hypothetical protein